MPPAAVVVAEMERTVRGEQAAAETSRSALVADLVHSNLRQWELEDTTRDPCVSDAVVANAKREIDRLNIGRHRLVQEIDSAIDSALDQPVTAPIATESPGMVLDRLSVLVIRRARTVAASSARSEPTPTVYLPSNLNFWGCPSPSIRTWTSSGPAPGASFRTSISSSTDLLCSLRIEQRRGGGIRPGCTHTPRCARARPGGRCPESHPVSGAVERGRPLP